MVNNIYIVLLAYENYHPALNKDVVDATDFLQDSPPPLRSVLGIFVGQLICRKRIFSKLYYNGNVFCRGIILLKSFPTKYVFDKIFPNKLWLPSYTFPTFHLQRWHNQQQCMIFFFFFLYC